MNNRKITVEELRNQHFPTRDVLSSFEERYDREHKLRSAMALTNGEHESVWVIIQLASGELVETNSNMIDLEDDYVELHGGVGIPLNAVYDVGV